VRRTIDEMTMTPAPPKNARLKVLREMAGKVVGEAFYGTLLRTMRNSKLKGEIGHGGRGEEVFQAQLHGIYAERMGMARRQPLVDAIYRTYAKQVEGLARRGIEEGSVG
jgi:hypothetical protein